MGITLKPMSNSFPGSATRFPPARKGLGHVRALYLFASVFFQPSLFYIQILRLLNLKVWNVISLFSD
jgi:hypothetical protein